MTPQCLDLLLPHTVVGYLHGVWQDLQNAQMNTASCQLSIPLRQWEVLLVNNTYARCAGVQPDSPADRNALGSLGSRQMESHKDRFGNALYTVVSCCTLESRSLLLAL